MFVQVFKNYSKRIMLILCSISLVVALFVFAPYLLHTTSKAQSASFTFTTVGDYGGTGTNFDAVLTTIKNTAPNVHFALGDLSYGELTPESAWADKVKGIVGPTFPFELVTGNHDDDTPAGYNINSYITALPDRTGNVVGAYGKEYYIDYPPAAPLTRFIMVSPDMTLDGTLYSYASGTSHYNWTVSAIDDARAKGIPWVVVGMHENCISVGTKSCSISSGFFNMLINKKVDLILQGHEHLYERSKQLAVNGTTCTAVPTSSYNSNCIADDGADRQYIKGKGSVLIIAGMGGQSLYDVNTTDSETGDFASSMGNNSNPTWGIEKFVVSATQIQASFVRASGGTFTDTFTITSCADCPTPTPAPMTPTPINAPVSVQTTSSSDDGEENITSGTMSLSSSDLELICDTTTTPCSPTSSSRQIAGMRFNGITIPNGATITNAYIEFTAKEAQSETTNLILNGQASDTAGAFTATTKDISNRTKTAASVAWDNLPAWSIGTKYQTPDIKTVIQEIVTRSGWTSGNSLALFITGQGHRTAYAFDGSATNAPRLVITYTTSAISPTTICPTINANAGSVTSSTTLVGGTYRIWSRILAPDTANNSLWLKIDNQCPINVGDVAINPNEWTWLDYRNGDTTNSVTVDIGAGTHTIALYAREDGVRIDKLLLLNDLNCVPANFGDNCDVVATITPSVQPTAMPTDIPTPSIAPTVIPTGIPTNTSIPTDTTKPSVSITSPINGSVVATNSILTISANASDNIGVTKVVFVVNGTTKCTDTTVPYTCNFKVPGNKGAVYAIQANAYDAANNIGQHAITVTSGNVANKSR
jgi:hypothetical protein